jgi:hypothetical protein
MRGGPGKRQREVLDAMFRHGGMWPTAWRIPFDKRDVFERLENRGLIERHAGTYRLVMA